MNGGVTYKDMDLRKIKARNLDDAREWLKGRIDSEKLITLNHILSRDLEQLELPKPKQ